MLRGRAVLRRPPRARGFLPGLMAGGTRRRTFEQQRVVSHPVDRIFGVVADVGRYDEFLPFCTGSRVVQRGEGTLSTEISVGYGPLVSNFSSKVALEPLRRVHAVSDPSELLESLEFTWTFKALSERATRLDLALDFEMRSLEHAIMWDLAKDRILQEYVDSFKQRCDLLETAARAAAPRKRE